jgi:hypothetical protein
MKRISEIPPELLAEMTPAVRVFVEALLLQVAQMRAEIEELKSARPQQSAAEFGKNLQK